MRRERYPLGMRRLWALSGLFAITACGGGGAHDAPADAGAPDAGDPAPAGALSVEVDPIAYRLALFDEVPFEVRIKRGAGFVDPVDIFSPGLRTAGGTNLSNEIRASIPAGATSVMVTLDDISRDGGDGIAPIFAVDRPPVTTLDPIFAQTQITGHALGSTELHDPAFGTGGRFTLGLANQLGAVEALAVQADGKLLVGGVLRAQVDAPLRSMPVTRLTADGTVDPSFAPSTAHVASVATSLAGEVRGLYVDDAGRIVALGAFRDFGSNADVFLARYTPTGAPDPTFGSQGVVVDALDPSLEINGTARAADGSLFVCGKLDNVFVIVKYTAAGARDTTFGDHGLRTIPLGAQATGALSALSLRPDGTLLAAGGAGAATPSAVVIALDSHGALIPTFATAGVLTVARPADASAAVTLDLLRDGTSSLIAISHQAAASPDTGDLAIERVRDDGTLDPSFPTLRIPGPFRPISARLAALPDGKFFVAATVSTVGDFQIALAARFDAHGTLDPSFGVAGRNPGAIGRDSSGYLTALALPSGAVFVGGAQSASSSEDWFVARYLP